MVGVVIGGTGIHLKNVVQETTEQRNTRPVAPVSNGRVVVPLDEYRPVRRSRPVPAGAALFLRAVALGTWWLMCAVGGLVVWTVGWAWVIDQYVTGGNLVRAAMVGGLLTAAAVAGVVLWRGRWFPGANSPDRTRALAGLIVIGEACALPWLWNVAAVTKWDVDPEAATRGGDWWWLVVALLCVALAGVWCIRLSGQTETPQGTAEV